MAAAAASREAPRRASTLPRAAARCQPTRWGGVRREGRTYNVCRLPRISPTAMGGRDLHAFEPHTRGQVRCKGGYSISRSPAVSLPLGDRSAGDGADVLDWSIDRQAALPSARSADCTHLRAARLWICAMTHGGTVSPPILRCGDGGHEGVASAQPAAPAERAQGVKPHAVQYGCDGVQLIVCRR